MHIRVIFAKGAAINCSGNNNLICPRNKYRINSDNPDLSGKQKDRTRDGGVTSKERKLYTRFHRGFDLDSNSCARDTVKRKRRMKERRKRRREKRPQSH